MTCQTQVWFVRLLLEQFLSHIYEELGFMGGSRTNDCYGPMVQSSGQLSPMYNVLYHL